MRLDKNLLWNLVHWSLKEQDIVICLNYSFKNLKTDFTTLTKFAHETWPSFETSCFTLIKMPNSKHCNTLAYTFYNVPSINPTLTFLSNVH